MRRRPPTLRAFVWRTLPLQLLGATVLLALLVGGLTWVREQARVSDAVVEAARLRLEFAGLRAARLQDAGGSDARAALRRALDEMQALLPPLQAGEFTRLRLYDAGGALMFEHARSDAAAAHATARLDRDRLRAAGGALAERVRIAGQPYLRLVLAVAGAGGNAAYAEGWFKLSERALAQSREHALRSMLYAALIVAATAFLLYPVILRLAARLARYSENLLEANLETLALLGSAIAKRDSDTDAHNFRVTLYAVTLAEAMGLDAECIRGLIKGAFLHDVGKIGIRDQILHKPGRLDEGEFRIMQTHVDHGADIVRRSRWLAAARDIVGQHHEKYDGSGYPAGLAGDNIAIEARIFAIVDVFDALTSARPYKPAFSCEDTLRILEEGRGSHFDPGLLDGFTAIARSLYERYAGRDDAGLRDEARSLVRRYFVDGRDSLDA